MFITNKLTGVTDGKIQTVKNGLQSRSGQYGTSKAVNASVMSGAGVTGAGNVSVVDSHGSEYRYMMTGIIPSDPRQDNNVNLGYFYRDIYMHDNTAGSAVDIQSSFPFSDFNLRGLTSSETKPFEEALERLNIRNMLPEISVSHLVDGFSCGTLIFDPRSKAFIDTMVHDALSCQVRQSPFYNLDPEIDVNINYSVNNIINSTSPYIRKYFNSLPENFKKLLRRGSFTLDPISTLFVPRRTLSDRAYMSFLHRILPMYLIEKSMYRGTLSESHRRQRAMTHVALGDDIWTPSPQEMDDMIRQLQMAESDPMGGWIATRNAVSVTDIRPAGDFWKWMDVVDQMVPYKLRALGISESFLSGDASYASAESAYSTFLETQNSYREQLTRRIFYDKIFPLVSVVNNLYKDDNGAKANEDVVSFLYNSNSRQNLKMPTLVWNKDLQPDGDEGLYDMLEKLSDRGVPVAMKTWIAAAGLDYEDLVSDLAEDNKIREALEQHTGKDTSHESELASTQLPMSMSQNMRQRKAILSRLPQGEIMGSTRTGKAKYIHNQKRANKEANLNIMKASKEMKDLNSRKAAADRNQERLGSTVLTPDNLHYKRSKVKYF